MTGVAILRTVDLEENIWLSREEKNKVIKLFTFNKIDSVPSSYQSRENMKIFACLISPFMFCRIRWCVLFDVILGLSIIICVSWKDGKGSVNINVLGLLKVMSSQNVIP